jgi:NADH dehydrogenase
VTVVDRRNHHLFQPMLYQVATAVLAESDIASPIRSILRHQMNTDVILAEASAVRVKDQVVDFTDGSSVHYDYLIIATGVRHSYFGHDDWEALAPGLKSLEDADEIRRRVLTAFERAERETDPARRHALLTFVVVGGGPTGVEVAGALAEMRSFALRRDFRHIDPREATVMLLEGGTRILPSYAPELSAKAKLTLRGLGVEVREQTMVTQIRPDSVSAAGWTIPTRTVVWAAGNTASPLTRTLGAPLDSQGRVLVEPDCTVPGHPRVFVLGDAAAVINAAGETLAGVCPVAIQMGQYAGKTIRRDLAGQTRQPFRYWDKGQLAVIGRGHAVADVGRLHFGGFLAWLAWIFIHIFFLIGFRNRVLVLFEWGWSYFTYQRGARILTGEATATHAIPPGSPSK